ncbi:MAG: hypothetical protein KJZ86_05460 [Caldilineaceae bacterium]|nr:hypothetical protein [Caldilineaceae bacterium]
MSDTGEYISAIRQMILLHPHVRSFRVVREEDQINSGLIRYRLTLVDGGLLELSERFRIIGGKVHSLKYRFHWQDSDRNLIARWDNTAHHLTLPTFPHHIHDGGEANIQPHAQVNIADVLAEIARRLEEKRRSGR